MINYEYWIAALRRAQAELDAATTRPTINTAATKLMRAEAELKRIEQTPASG
jgi:hypothetical protein